MNKKLLIIPALVFLVLSVAVSARIFLVPGDQDFSYIYYIYNLTGIIGNTAIYGALNMFGNIDMNNYNIMEVSSITANNMNVTNLTVQNMNFTGNMTSNLNMNGYNITNANTITTINLNVTGGMNGNINMRNYNITNTNSITTQNLNVTGKMMGNLNMSYYNITSISYTIYNNGSAFIGWDTSSKCLTIAVN